MTVYEPPAIEAKPISVRELLADVDLGLTVRLLAGASGVGREIRHPRIQKSGLAMVGHRHGIVANRVQVIGETELSYVVALEPAGQAEAARNLFSLGLTCVLVTCGRDPPPAFAYEADRTGTPLLVCDERSSSAITALHTLLDDRLAPRTREHGVMIDVFEVGVLLLGRSGIGKSECALDLVMRGHRLVADDAVEFDYRPPGMVFGQASPLLKYHIEVRGLGILNLKDLYGVTAVRDRKRLDLIVQLETWREDGEYDRLGVEDHHREVLGVPVRQVFVPVRPGRNISSLVEMAARDDLLRQAGHHSARAFIERIDQASAAPASSGQRAPESSAPPPFTSGPGLPASPRVPRAVLPTESSAPPPVATTRAEGGDGK